MRNTHSKEPFSSSPPDSLSDEELLSLLLSYSESAPTETSAHLLRHFSNLANLLDAGPDALCQVQGLSVQGSSLIRLVAELHRRYLFIRSRSETQLLSRESIANYLSPLFAGAAEEQVFLLCMDDGGRVLGCSCVAKGDVDSARISLRTLVKDALLKGAKRVVLAHNHPCGRRYPSKEDVQTTLELRDLLQPLDICLMDHLIFSSGGVCSMVECGYYRA